jgi:hypothetical protein
MTRPITNESAVSGTSASTANVAYSGERSGSSLDVAVASGVTKKSDSSPSGFGRSLKNSSAPAPMSVVMVRIAAENFNRFPYSIELGPGMGPSVSISTLM